MVFSVRLTDKATLFRQPLISIFSVKTVKSVKRRSVKSIKRLSINSRFNKKKKKNSPIPTTERKVEIKIYTNY